MTTVNETLTMVGLTLYRLLLIFLDVVAVSSISIHLRYNKSGLVSDVFPRTLSLVVAETHIEVSLVPYPRVPVYVVTQTSNGRTTLNRKKVKNHKPQIMYTDPASRTQLEVTKFKDFRDNHAHLQLKSGFLFKGKIYNVKTSSRKRRESPLDFLEKMPEVVDDEYEASLETGPPLMRDIYFPPPINTLRVFNESKKSGNMQSYGNIKLHRLQASNVSEYYIDVAAVIDHTSYNYFYYNAEVKANVFNEIYLRYAYLMTGVDLHYQQIRINSARLRIVLNKIVILTSLKHSPFSSLLRNNYVERAMVDFRYWSIGNGSSVLLSYDIAIFFTKRALYWYSKTLDKSYQILGVTYGGGLCNPSGFGIALVQDRGDFSTSPIAHEIGHSLNASHDGYNNHCKGDGSVMAAQNNGNEKLEFSECSIEYFTKFVNDLLTKDNGEKCLTTKYVDDATVPDIDERLPGQYFSPDDQCRIRFGRNSYMCRESYEFILSEICNNLSCFKPDTESCVNIKTASGTPCGNQKICMAKHCRADPRGVTMDETCPFGELGIEELGIDCLTMIQSFPGHCYDHRNYKRCCVSCEIIRQKWAFCRYGDRRQNCDLSNCVHDVCCGTCFDIEFPFIIKLTTNPGIFIFEDDNLSLTCSTIADNVTSYEFRRDNRSLVTSPSNMYTIQSARLGRDDGVYRCIVIVGGNTSWSSNSVMVTLAKRLVPKPTLTTTDIPTTTKTPPTTQSFTTRQTTNNQHTTNQHTTNQHIFRRWWLVVVGMLIGFVLFGGGVFLFKVYLKTETARLSNK